MEITFRVASEQDVAGIAGVKVATWQTAYRGIVPDEVLAGLSLPEIEKFFCSCLANDVKPKSLRQLYVAEFQGEVVGYIHFGAEFSGNEDPKQVGEIYALYLKSEYWDSGTGKKLLQEALTDMERDGFKEVILWVLDTNERGRSFYERAGFTPDGGSKVDTSLVSSPLREIRYRKEINMGIAAARPS